jgi:type I restriction enzyme R subunit
VEHFQKREVWDQLTETERETLQREVAGLPSEKETDDIEARLFDLVALRMQLAHVEGSDGSFEKLRNQVSEIAMLLEEKSTIPAVRTQLEYIAGMQETAFWECISLEQLEDMRLRLRGLVQFLDKKKRKIVYTSFRDEVLAVREGEGIYIPKMTGVQYEKKVRDYLRNHLDHIVIQRLRTNQPLTKMDLEGLETTLAEIGEEDGKTLLSDMLSRSGAPSLVHFVRGLVGMDRAAAQAAFSQFLNDRSLTAPQIRFIEMIIDQLTSRGVMEAAALYEPPFSHLHAGGPEGLFAGNERVIEGVFKTLESMEPQMEDFAG